MHRDRDAIATRLLNRADVEHVALALFGRALRDTVRYWSSTSPLREGSVADTARRADPPPAADPPAPRGVDGGLDEEFETPEQEAAYSAGMEEIGRRFGLGPYKPAPLDSEA